MRAVLQRVSEARVEVDGETVGAIDRGILVLLAVGRGDSVSDADYLAEKIAGLRVFPDEQGKMNSSIVEAGGSLLVVSQFTLYGDCRKGRRPSFDLSAPPDLARELYLYFLNRASKSGVPVQAGVFQAHMKVYLVNDGPVTFLLESSKSVIDKST
jgi:D-aminoacyl-tRNA deacylase